MHPAEELAKIDLFILLCCELVFGGTNRDLPIDAL